MPRTVSYKRVTSSVTVSAAGTSWIEVYTSTDSDSDFVTLMLTNTTSASDVKAYLSITSGATDGDGTSGVLKARVLYGLTIESGDVLSFSNETLHLDKGQQLWIKSDTADGLSVYGKIIRSVKVITQT